VVTIAPALAVLPTATQLVVDAHETLASWVMPLGNDWLVHVVPPSDVVTIAPALAVVPTATQKVVDAHETLMSWVMPLGNDWLVHVVPPSALTMATALVEAPPSDKFSPTATQRVPIVHETPLNS
jgi:hypothetical protein